VGFNTEIITKNDFAKLIQFDALFIRETTNVNHYTFRFAKKAENEGLVVIDDPESILKCTNKVYLSELLNANSVAAPKTKIIQKINTTEDLAGFEYPFILKQPDGSFSKGVKKVENEKELNVVLKDLFQKSDLLIAQEFFPTEFDWRVGLMDGKTLYVCKYFMAPKHWQVMDWSSSGKLNTYGHVETIAVADAPKGLIEIAEKAGGLIGTGLYGVDVKERDGKFYIIEVNDNPSIDDGTEERVLKSELYTSIMQSIMNRLL
jgi:glutathione synthase/RimK-type ligase-like ATP-grasp enzyme